MVLEDLGHREGGREGEQMSLGRRQRRTEKDRERQVSARSAHPGAAEATLAAGLFVGHHDHPGRRRRRHLLQNPIGRLAAAEILEGQACDPRGLKIGRLQQKGQHGFGRDQVGERALQPVAGAGDRHDGESQRAQMLDVLVHRRPRQTQPLRQGLAGEDPSRLRVRPGQRRYEFARQRDSMGQPLRDKTARHRDFQPV